MNRLLAAGLLLSAALPALADEQPKSAQPWLAADVQDVIYLGETRPVLLRLHLFVDGKPYSVSWNDYVKRLFDYLDRDEDGFLSRAEQGRMPSATQFQMQLQNFYFQPNTSPAPPFADVDTDKDGKVSLEEFGRYYQKSEVGPVRITSLPGLAQQTGALTDTLFRLLDTDKDGKLSRAELEAAPNVLRKFDQDDDDLVTAAELQNMNFGNVYGQAVFQRVNPNMGGMGQQAQVPFLVVPREAPGDLLMQRLKIAKDLLARYDHNKDGKLSREELGFSKELFDWLKPNETGTVDSTNLLRWLLALPDVELSVRLGKSEQGKGIEVIETARQQVPTLPVQKLSAATLGLKLGRVSLNIGRSDNAGMRVANNYVQFLLQQFRQVDSEKKGFVTAKQLQIPQYQFLRNLMTLADRDGDEKLTEKEVLEYVEVMGGMPESTISLLSTDSGQGLFELLDANRDGRLSIRELRQAWNRLRDYDEDGDGKISRTELPRQYQLTINKGTSVNSGYNPQVQAQIRGMQPVNFVPASTAGPLWFRKMDVNGDGDVSPREFLGSPEDFARIDTDGDGLISLEEAIKADAWLKEKLKPRP